MAKKIGIPIHVDFPMNVFNNTAIRFFEKQAVHSITLSPELTMRQVENICERTNLPLECIVHGALPLMISEYCVLGSFIGQMHANK